MGRNISEMLWKYIEIYFITFQYMNAVLLFINSTTFFLPFSILLLFSLDLNNKYNMIAKREKYLSQLYIFTIYGIARTIVSYSKEKTMRNI